MVSRYSEATEQQKRILDHVMKPDAIGKLARFMAHVINVPTDEAVNRARVLIASAIGGLRYGEPYYWSADMSRIMAASCDGFPGDYALHHYDLPTETGFFWFEQGVDIGKYYEEQFYIRAMSWVQASKSDANPNWILPMSLETPGMTAADSAAIILYCSKTKDGHVYPQIFFPWTYGQTVEQQLRRYTMTPGKTEDQIRFQLQLVGAALMFLTQKVVTTETQLLERSYRRRLQRRKDWNHISNEVKVIYLRRQEEKDFVDDQEKGEAYVRFTKRWFVRPHWRRQWYPSQERHIPLRISGHVKGPADMPLDESTATRLYVVNR